MIIDKSKVKSVFTAYTDNYNSKDTKIKLKIDHTFRVADMCEKIAEHIGMPEGQCDLAWLIGMLHDVGRFEQVRIYNTFSDADSIDHAQFGADLLFKEGLLDTYIDRKTSELIEGTDELTIVENAIRNHSAYRIAENLSEIEKKFCNIIRDADKIDILRVNTELPKEEIYNVTTKELKEAFVTKEVLEAFNEEHAVLRALKKSPVDHVVGHISLVYELVYDYSYSLLCEQGYIYEMLDFESDNSQTADDFQKIKSHMTKYIEDKVASVKI